jgi:hypothetical protein
MALVAARTRVQQDAVAAVRARIVDVAARYRSHVLLELDPCWVREATPLSDVVLAIVEATMALTYEVGGRGTTITLRISTDEIDMSDDRTGCSVELRLPEAVRTSR